eukprot:TRINITY_DN68930_c0_g1_i1.p1 TRINITY_DN68930_c0_g1~~TRINITY_DN68930_c0_g1_i1.p1  ORF type:complete len:379 (-),score=48.17 TRINITY_DN68930_c0_g1_i1:260-1396(-)
MPNVLRNSLRSLHMRPLSDSLCALGGDVVSPTASALPNRGAVQAAPGERTSKDLALLGGGGDEFWASRDETGENLRKYLFPLVDIGCESAEPCMRVPTAPTMSRAIAASRGKIHNAASARAWATSAPEALPLHGKCLAYFNGAFSPPTRAHAHIAQVVADAAEVNALWIDPEPSRPGKPRWLDETLKNRIQMCSCMADLLSNEKTELGVGSLRHDLGTKLGESIELFQCLREVLGGIGSGRLLWVLGADVLESMQYWAEKARTCVDPGVTCDGLVVFVRGNSSEVRVREVAAKVFGEERVASEGFLCVHAMPADLAEASSHRARKELVNACFAPEAQEASRAVDKLLLPAVRSLCTSEVLNVYQEQVINTPRGTPRES